MRFIGIILISIIPLLIGVNFAINAKKSLKQADAVVMMIDEIASYMGYQAMTLDEIMTELSQSERYAILGFDKWKAKDGSFCMRIGEFLRQNDLLKMGEQAKTELISFFTMLGKSDVEAQRQICLLFKQKFNEILKREQSESPKKQKLSLSIGILSSIFAIIVLI